jgi:23S rRNA U2552 (ribose-2'-O)-methylase RlmE/FtsJ
MDITSQITRHSNLKDNDSLSCFQNNSAQQFHGAYQVFYDFLRDVKPVRILEIGTALGGFTQFLKTACDDLRLNTNILSYDIASKDWYPDIIAKGIDLRVENIFSPDYRSVKKDVVDFIMSDGVTIVLCDGGWKIGEFNLLSKYIKPGDYILAHDYANTVELFEKEINFKIWNWCEITEADIELACEFNELVPYKEDVFQSAAWVCKRKLT